MISDGLQRQYSPELLEMLGRLELEPELADLEAVKARLVESFARIDSVTNREAGSPEMMRRDILEMAAEFVLVAKSLRLHGRALAALVKEKRDG